MKTPLQNLLIGCALGLCALCVWQWHVQVRQYRERTALSQTLANQSADLQHSTNSLAIMDLQIAHQDSQLQALRDAARAHQVELRELREETNRLGAAISQVQTAAETQIQKANATIRQQNELLKNLADQRDDFVKRLNDVIQDRNAVVTKYNDLVKRLAESPATAGKLDPAPKQ